MSPSCRSRATCRPVSAGHRRWVPASASPTSAPAPRRPLFLSDALWRQRFGADPAVVGRTLPLDGVAHEVRGVMPPDFDFPSAGVDLWVPMTVDAASPVGLWARTAFLVGRLRPGVSLEVATDEVRALGPHGSFAAGGEILRQAFPRRPGRPAPGRQYSPPGFVRKYTVTPRPRRPPPPRASPRSRRPPVQAIP